MIVLASAEGKAVNAIAHALSVARPMVYLWRRRFEKAGV
jgi:transposase-like protein